MEAWSAAARSGAVHQRCLANYQCTGICLKPRQSATNIPARNRIAVEGSGTTAAPKVMLSTRRLALAAGESTADWKEPGVAPNRLLKAPWLTSGMDASS